MIATFVMRFGRLSSSPCVDHTREEGLAELRSSDWMMLGMTAAGRLGACCWNARRTLWCVSAQQAFNLALADSRPGCLPRFECCTKGKLSPRRRYRGRYDCVRPSLKVSDDVGTTQQTYFRGRHS